MVTIQVNEFGSATTMRIHGVHLISEGTGVSVDNQPLSQEIGIDKLGEFGGSLSAIA